jgi:uncharacterized membrane protein
MRWRELGSFAVIIAVLVGATGGVLALLIALGITNGTMLGIVGSGVIAATAWLIERRSF